MLWTEKLEQQCYEMWKTKKAVVNLSMTFGGAIQYCGTPSEAGQHLTQLDAKLENNETVSAADEGAARLEETDDVEVTYRALSAAMLADRPVDFSNATMLKRATKMLNGQTVFKDHNTSVDNWVGRVVEALWDTDTKGFPPGINAKLRLDAVKDPMVVRGVLQGAIHSASVTVSFEWKPSHEGLMEDGSFFQKLGEEVDGDMVRVIVTKIEKFWEISLVWQGADEFAKQIGEDGKPVHQSAEPDMAVAASMNQDTEETTPASSLVDENITNKAQEATMKKLLEQLKDILGAEVTEETVGAAIDTFVTQKQTEAKQPIEELANTKIEELVGQLDAATEDVKAKTKKIEELTAAAKLGKEFLEAERAEATRLCKLAKGEEVSDAILKTLETSELEVVQAWKDEFQKEVDAKFPAVCAKCGSKDISRKSSKESTEEPVEEKRVVNAEASNRLNDLHG